MAGEGKTFQRHYDIPTSQERITSGLNEGLKGRVIAYTPKIDGTLSIRLRADSEGAASGVNFVTRDVLGGIQYAGDVEGVDITSSTAGQEVVLDRQV